MLVLLAALFYPALVRQRGLRFAPLSALRGTSGGASMTTPAGAGTALQDASVQLIVPRARRTGFSHGVEVSSVYLASALRFALVAWGKARAR
jgi:hypothetical protein